MDSGVKRGQAMNDYTKGMLTGILEAVRWSFALIVGGGMLSYLLFVFDTYFIHPEHVTMLFSDSVRLLGIPDDIASLKGRFLSAYVFIPFIQGSVLFAAMAKAMSLIYQSLLVPFFKRP